MKTATAILSVLLIILLFSESLNAQQTYSRMRISFTDGTSIEGKKGTIERSSVILNVGNTMQNYSLDEVDLIMARKGRAGKYALGFGGGCLGIGLLVTAVNPNDDEVGTLLAGSLLWAGIFAGVGAAVGALSDPWTNVYYRRAQSSVLDRIDLTLSSNRITPYNVGVVYTLK